LQHLAGDHYLLNSYLNAVEELHASSLYHFDGQCKFIKSNLEKIEGADSQDFDNHLFKVYDAYTDHVTLLLSGGYHSRLNLSAA